MRAATHRLNTPGYTYIKKNTSVNVTSILMLSKNIRQICSENNIKILDLFDFF